MNQCINSNSIGTNAVFNYCLKNKIKLIYSATSASLGNKGSDKNLSPYAFTKAKNLELLENLKKWFNFKYEVIYFYNVYGPNQICEGDMATVIGIFENNYKKRKSLPVVKPGSQTRRFTHIFDTVERLLYGMEKKTYVDTIVLPIKKHILLMRLQKCLIKKLDICLNAKEKDMHPPLLNKNLSNKVYKYFGKIELKNYIQNFLFKAN